MHRLAQNPRQELEECQFTPRNASQRYITQKLSVDMTNLSSRLQAISRAKEWYTDTRPKSATKWRCTRKSAHARRLDISEWIWRSHGRILRDGRQLSGNATNAGLKCLIC